MSRSAFPDRPLSLDDAPGCALLRDSFHRAGYLPGNLQRLFGLTGQVPPAVLDTPVCLRRLRGDGPLATLARIFQLQGKVSMAAARAALSPLDPERLQSLGLLNIKDGEVSSPFTIVPFEGCLFVSDTLPPGRAAAPANCVVGINPTSVLLAQITIRRSVQTALDIGTGCGVQALLAARHVGRVVASDINPRALNLTAFNALLNGVANVECRPGSFFESVAGEMFDLIVANPPFVISPESRYLYRDDNRTGDAVVAGLLSRLPDFLNEGGLAHLLGNWVCEPRGDWAEPVGRWLRNRGCDVLAILQQCDDPLTYAARWLRVDWPASPIDFEQALDQWLNYYRDCGIEAIASGAISLRKRSENANWFQGFGLGAELNGFCGEQFERLLRIQDFCAIHLRTAEELLNCRLKLRDHDLEEIKRFAGGRYQRQSSVLRLRENLPFTLSIDGFGLQLLSSCDGRLALRDVLREVAERFEVNLDDLLPTALASIRQLLVRGYLHPIELSDG